MRTPPAAPTDLPSALARVKRDPEAVGPLPVGAVGLALRLVTPADTEDDALVERLGAWRARWMAHYPTQFTVTSAGTRAWLRDRVLGDPYRLMFLVVDEADPHGAVHGHLGFDRPDPATGSLELSNVLNGDRERLPYGALEAAERRMLAWAVETLGITGSHGVVFEDHGRSRHLQERVGFVAGERIGLRRIVDGDTVVFRPRASGDEDEPDRWWVRYRWTPSRP